MEFKPLEIKPRGSRIRRLASTSHFKRSAIAILAGAIIGFVLFYVTEGRMMDSMESNDIIKSLLIGGFFGFFVTNSPCARGRC